MKKFIQFLCFFVASAIGGCANIQTQTPAQVAAKVCPPLTNTITGMQSLVGLAPVVIKALDDANKVVTPVCSADFSSVAGTDLKTMVKSSVPKLVAVIKMTNLSDDKKNEAILLVEATQVALEQLP